MLYIGKNIKDIPDSEFKEVIDSVDLYDICNYIISLDTESWVPGCYWSRAKVKQDSEKILEYPHYGEIMWAIYSYLVHNKILIIENEYYRHNNTVVPGANRESLFRTRDGYYNPLESQLYNPIFIRLLNEKFLTVSEFTNHGSNTFKIGSSYHRISNLEKLNI